MHMRVLSTFASSAAVVVLLVQLLAQSHTFDAATVRRSAPRGLEHAGDIAGRGLGEDMVYTQTPIIDGGGVANEAYGASVAMSSDGTWLVIGAAMRVVAGRASGAALAYYSANPAVDAATWTQLPTMLNASDGMGGDSFGQVVALSGDGATALVTAPTRRTQQGGAYIFLRDGSGPDAAYAQASLLLQSDVANGDYFGNSASLSADGVAAVVGAPMKMISGLNRAGKVYLFRKSEGGLWGDRPERSLVLNDVATDDMFGDAVAIDGSGHTVAVASPGRAIDGVLGRGQVFVYTRGDTGNSWQLAAALASPDGASGAGFGSALALDSAAHVLAIGSMHATVDGALNRGAAFVFSSTDRISWGLMSKLIALDGTADDSFGASVSISSDGGCIVVGAHTAEANNNPAAGRAYVFTPNGTGWQQANVLTRDSANAYDYFGVASDQSATGSLVVVGAYSAAVSGKEGQGMAVVFRAQPAPSPSNSPTGTPSTSATATTSSSQTASGSASPTRSSSMTASAPSTLTPTPSASASRSPNSSAVFPDTPTYDAAGVDAGSAVGLAVGIIFALGLLGLSVFCLVRMARARVRFHRVGETAGPADVDPDAEAPEDDTRAIISRRPHTAQRSKADAGTLQGVELTSRTAGQSRPQPRSATAATSAPAHSQAVSDIEDDDDDNITLHFPDRQAVRGGNARGVQAGRLV